MAKTVFISGSGRNIGRAIAVRLARDGFNVVLNGSHDRAACERVAREVEDAGSEAMIAIGDVGKSADVRAMAASALERFGRIDALVNNAAIRPQKKLLEMTDEDWDRVISVDLNAAFYLSRAFLPGMVEAGWGRIVNFAGMNAIHGYAGRAPVSAAKHGVWGLTKALAKEFGPEGVTANVISPGPIRPDESDHEHAEHIRSQLSRIPVGRLGEAEDIAAMVSLLCGNEGGFVNGQMLAVNGGTET
ncbi:SDR family oxidoreductase [Nisaea acidiphila]|uniref:SDR family oxidoreductase n=1 Tax=Nisaea acidiphila TaxID=1862145 RepID=A0A9J7B0D3_9PROT|nr:SDR family oxidoreductase [Nisaea acidiphila]UUX51149.1 SDR family oxidoreductase [Nisaea acidiphila]